MDISAKRANDEFPFFAITDDGYVYLNDGSVSVTSGAYFTTSNQTLGLVVPDEWSLDLGKPGAYSVASRAKYVSLIASEEISLQGNIGLHGNTGVPQCSPITHPTDLPTALAAIDELLNHFEARGDVAT